MDISILKGKVIEAISIKDCDAIFFKISENEIYQMYHHQDCCESVTIEEIHGDLDWLLNSPILLAEERVSDAQKNNSCDSQTWTFYEIATLKGSVTIRWYGTSNGYYSESVDFERMV